jgi:hypothetical protein
MTSFRQWQANRRNARKSTGPITQDGKRQSRCNAVRHGLIAETVIGALEDAEDYATFEAAIIADYDAQSAVERELVLRLASLLWRSRRAITIETGLFQLQAENLNDGGQNHTHDPMRREIVYAAFDKTEAACVNRDPISAGSGGAPRASSDSPRQHVESERVPTATYARCFLRLSSLPNFALDRLSRYEVTLWRQVDRILVALDALDRRKPQERGRFFLFDNHR